MPNTLPALSVVRIPLSDGTYVTRELHSVRPHYGIAGQLAITAVTSYRYGNGEPSKRVVVFYGSTYGTPGTVHMDIDGTFHRVDDPERFGETFGTRWVSRFYETA